MPSDMSSSSSLDEAVEDPGRRPAATSSRRNPSFSTQVARGIVRFRAPRVSTDLTRLKAASNKATIEEGKGLCLAGLVYDALLKVIGEKSREKRQSSLQATRFLDDNVLNEIFEFLGKGHYLPVGGSCRRFRRIYKRIDTHTWAEDFVQTPAGAKLFYSVTKDASLHFRIGQRGQSPHSAWPFGYSARMVAPMQFVFDVALLNGRWDVLKALNLFRAFDKTPLDRKWTCTLAASSGDLRLLQWAKAKGCPWDASTCEAAVRSGNLDVLQWARAQGCPWDYRTCSEAARNGDLEMLQWARKKGCPWTEATCTNAAMNRHLEVLKWACGNDCPRTSSICSWASMNGDLEMLQWAYAHGCPWGARTAFLAEQYGHTEVLLWALAHGCPT